jgi:hypothetical protein
MASRNTLDTNLLRIRSVTAFNPNTSEFIQPAQIPVIGDQGAVKWMSSLQFLSSISVPKVSCSVLDILNTVQPGISTMSTIGGSTIRSYLTSTVAGLGTSSYVSTSYINEELDRLSMNHGYYISTTTLYDVILSLSNMSRIDSLGPIPRATNWARLMTGGYVHTMNPGNYTRYQSSLRGGNQMTVAMNQNFAYPGATLDMGGYKNKFVNTSKLTLDIFNGATLTFTGGATAETAVSTFITSTGTLGYVFGDPVVYSIPTGTTSFSIPMTRFYIPPSRINLNNIPNSLTIGYRANVANATLYENVPTIGGLFVTLDNTD